MTDAHMEGEVSFINHDKAYIMIEYLSAGKKKNVKAKIDEATQHKWVLEKKIKKAHHFSIGDVVHFRLKATGQGDRMMATDIVFKYNNALDSLIHKSQTHNRFTGYLKVVEDAYFIKELESYLFFPLQISPWQRLPAAEDLNEQVQFSLINTSSRDRVRAALIHVKYIPEYETALKYFKSKKIIEATVNRVTAHSIYLEIVGNKIIGKISAEIISPKNLKPGDKVSVIISHLSPEKIALLPVRDDQKED